MRLARRSEVEEVLQKNGIDLAALRAAARPGGDDDLEDEGEPTDATPSSHRLASLPSDPAQARLAADIARQTRQRILAAVVAAAEAAPLDDNRFATLVYETLLNGGFHNAVVDTVKRRVGKTPKGEQPGAALANLAGRLDTAGLRALVLELCLSRGAYFIMSSEKYPRDLARAIEAYGIDAAAIEKAVTEELAAKRAARHARTKPGTA
jgi:ParB family transcriptional regulator, chromosome partitioning protein